MSVTNLTGTTWLMNDTVSISSGLSVNINFKDNELNEYVKFEILAGALLNYFDTPSSRIFAYSSSSGWYYEKFKTITFTGGEGVTNTDLITWLELNATQVKPIRPDFYKVIDLELTSIADAIRNTASISGSLTFPNDFISEIESIGGYANIAVDDYYNRTYTSVEAGVSEIGPGTFYQHSSLTTASFPNCTTIGSRAFALCYSLTIASFPNCSYIGGYAFTQCSLLTNASFPKCTSIGNNVFLYCSALTSVSFPNCTSIGINVFQNCHSLTTALFPNCTSIGDQAFFQCYLLTTASFPECTFIGSSAFFQCHSLTTISFPNCTFIGSYAFVDCYNLTSLNFMGISQVPSLPFSNAFDSTPIAGYTASTGGVYGSIYVPSSLLTSFKTATNWTYFSDRMVGV